ncbi:N-glycosylase/DNA lyase [Leptidea sinapis]|uniref:N-glycosylase/DNA lyase n=1 Tax=Leptidea sinapis TaxID=189913 RepID=A0A5E4QLR3_9NEOP|nr:N-glycosylase/DNA lyase [Leptidea sinapis]VVC97868.1 unnamed protein product [Leptidea sinapis]
MNWNKILYQSRELQLLGTLNGGQSFRWSYNNKNNEWTGVFAKTVWILHQDEESLQFKVIGSLLDEKNDYSKILENYFRLDIKLLDHYKMWSEQDEYFKTVCKQFYGLRMLAQDPVENLFSFICSQNNHITRISSLVEKLCKHYGERICDYDGATYYAFPVIEKLAETKVESELRKLGFGYRAKFIQKSAAQIQEWGGETWLKGLQEMKYIEARQELMKLCGIGPKVADCICLMSLNHLEALPVDTHVYQIAAHHYLPHLRGKKTVTEKMYKEIGDHFRKIFGDMAGWAHTVLFCADLKKFQTETSIDEIKTKRRKK